MTEFEYFSTMVAVILALGVTHILGQIGRVAQNRGIAKIYWVHAYWVILVLLAHFAAWWNIWQLRASLTFSFPGLIYILIGPTALFLAARVLVPRGPDAASSDLETHYFAVHRTFFVLMAVFLIWPMLISLLYGGPTSLTGIMRHVLLVVPVAMCATSSSRQLHAIVAVTLGAIFLVAALAGTK